MRRSLLTNLLSSMTLCATLKLGRMRLARQSSTGVSAASGSTACSHSSASASSSLSTCSATAYSSTLFSSSSFCSVPTRLSNTPFSTSHTHIRQYTSNTTSSPGSSSTSSASSAMHWALMSELGWPSILSSGSSRLASTTSGMCSCPSSCSADRMLSISSSAWQQRIGSVGYFMRRLMSVSYSSSNCSRHAANRTTDTSTPCSPSSCFILQQMEGLIGERLGKTILGSIVLLFVGVVVGVVRLVTGSYLVGVAVLVWLVWLLLRQVGAFVMYPGSFFLSRSDLEMRLSRELGARMVGCFNALHALSHCIAQRTYNPYQQQVDFQLAVDRHISSMTTLLEMFESSLSTRKTALLRNYRTLRTALETASGTPAIADLILNPRLISSLEEAHLGFYRERFLEISGVIREMAGALQSFAPPSGTYDLLRHRMSEENLFELRFGFHNWAALYQFERFTVHSQDAHLETAIIHAARRSPLPATQKAVLFCNPNGVFIQFFGVDNEYVGNYLRQGYRVILWNYRGYGDSTGRPSIRRSQTDAAAVYQFYRARGLEIEIVHGYSIGGAAAVGVMEAEAKGPQLPGDRIRALIVDRSFSSIGEMSIEFGSTLHNLTRLIFFADNIDLSKQFEAVRCPKLLIWDYCDEVIPDKASVKNRILKRRSQPPNRKQNSEDDRLCLSEEGAGRSAASFEEVVQQLEWTVGRLLELRRDGDSSDKELNEMLEREASGSTVSGEGLGVEGLVRLVGRVDGGGIELFHNLSQLDQIRAKKAEYFHHICESYVLGLVCYGSYFPLKPIVHDHGRIKAQTLEKIDLLVGQLGGPASFRGSGDGGASQLQSNFASIFGRLRQLVEECFCEEWFALHGSLLPTNNGHNSPLTALEFQVLNEFIRNRLTLDQPNAHNDII